MSEIFTLATVFNMNVLQSNNAGDVSLDAITVMAQAGGEGGGGCWCRHTSTYLCCMDYVGGRILIFTGDRM
ncbi:MAG TPA: hypothetical protein VLZ83_15370 [Edaphocola sp.]|nr:hypothetical protein [Edaphocola sp.]